MNDDNATPHTQEEVTQVAVEETILSLQAQVAYFSNRCVELHLMVKELQRVDSTD